VSRSGPRTSIGNSGQTGLCRTRTRTPAQGPCASSGMAQAHATAPRPSRSPGRRPRSGEGDPAPGRLCPPGRRRRRHALGRQPGRARLPRPAQDSPRLPLHGLRARLAPAGSVLDRHVAGPAADQPPGTPRTRPRRIEPELTTRIFTRAPDCRASRSAGSSPSCSREAAGWSYSYPRPGILRHQPAPSHRGCHGGGDRARVAPQGRKTSTAP
jgi:hypothetical protein